MPGSVVEISIVRPVFGSTTRAAGARPLPLARQHEVVIVAAAQLELRMVAVDALADGRLAPEVERRALDRGQLAGRNLVRVDRRVAVRVQRQAVAENSRPTRHRRG